MPENQTLIQIEEQKKVHAVLYDSNYELSFPQPLTFNFYP